MVTRPSDLSATPQWRDVDRAMKRFGYQQDALIELLHIAQEAFGHLSPPILEHIAHQLKLPLSWVFGVASFYHFFSFQENAPHTCIVCTGTACYVEGAQQIVDQLQESLGVDIDQPREAADLNLISFRCPGSCGLAPVVILDGQMIGRATPESILQAVQEQLAQPADPPAREVQP